MARFETFKNEVTQSYRVYLKQKNFNFFKEFEFGELWEGVISLSDDGIESKLGIYFPWNFPYEPPMVCVCSDEDFVKNSRHQNDKLLCLWNEGEWNPNITPDDFYKRIEMWFQHSKNNDWENKDRRADLDRHFHSNNILAINDDEWSNFQFNSSYGYYEYTILSFNNYPQGVFIYNPKDGVCNKSGLYLPASDSFTNCNSNLLKEFHYFKQDITNTKRGLWFNCKDEIRPCQTFKELKTQIYRLCNTSENIIDDEFKKLLAKNKNIMFSIIYEDNDKNKQYIHFDYNKDDDKLVTYKTCNCNEVNLTQRISHLKTKLQDKKIAIFGIGAIGSFVAESLGRHGLNEIKLIDHDTLEPQNIIRHALSACFIGLKKAFALSQIINNFSLGFTKTNYICESIFDERKYIEIIKDVDIVIDCTANKNFSLMLNHLCVENKKLAVYVTSHKKATIGKIIVVRPNIDPCLCCYYGKDGIIDNYEKFDYPYITQNQDDEIILGCGDITYPGVSSDIEMIAIWGVKVVLWLLQNKFENNFCLIVNEIQNDENLNPVFHRVGNFFRTFKKLEGCEICDK